MLRVVEAFSGIGSQAKALERLGKEFEILATIEWDINAICAYDIIHHGKPNLRKYQNYSKNQLISILNQYTLSSDGKKPLNKSSLNKMNIDALKTILSAIERTKNMISITDVEAKNLPENIDLFTYSFPCQDLSIGSAWHGNKSGIDRNAHNRSGMLWEVERILKESVSEKINLPKFLLMENVSNILSEQHRHNFLEWQNYLKSIGYENKIYTLNASNFGIPQTRVRTYMLSVNCGNDLILHKKVRNFLDDINNDLEVIQYTHPKKMQKLETFLRTDYSIDKYRLEADYSNQNDTPSRRKIYEENIIIFDGKDVITESVKTITTKQDRNPNSGIIVYNSKIEGKAPYRTLTPRECFLLMGFDEEDFEKLIKNNFDINKNRKMYGYSKLIKLAGNSIVVNVLEEIFKLIYKIDEEIIKYC